MSFLNVIRQPKKLTSISLTKMQKFSHDCERKKAKCAKCEINYRFIDENANETREKSSLNVYASLLQEKFHDALYTLQGKKIYY